MTSVEHTHIPHAPRLTVVRVDQGWEIREHREDNTVVRVSRHTDWHKLERSLQALELGLAVQTPS
jgi:hypothetical protein